MEENPCSLSPHLIIVTTTTTSNPGVVSQFVTIQHPSRVGCLGVLSCPPIISLHSPGMCLRDSNFCTLHHGMERAVCLTLYLSNKPPTTTTTTTQGERETPLLYISCSESTTNAIYRSHLEQIPIYHFGLCTSLCVPSRVSCELCFGHHNSTE